MNVKRQHEKENITQLKGKRQGYETRGWGGVGVRMSCNEDILDTSCNASNISLFLL